MRTKKEAVENLSGFVQAFTAADVKTREQFRAWCKENVERMQGWFWYPQRKGYPPITALVDIDFHPTLPLVMLNYSKAAHAMLHSERSDGWTLPLRLCRGIVFETTTGFLVALPFPKFFNFGEHEESKNLPKGPFVATEKYDGHLGIIFEHHAQLHITTRGRFTSPTVQFAEQMLREYVRKKRWDAKLESRFTLLVEVIHPRTHVHTDYPRQKKFVLLGVSDRTNLSDLDRRELVELGQLLGLPIAKQWEGKSIAELRRLMKDRTVKNQEGFVVRFEDGRRVKFKFEAYIGLMVAAKLTHAYLAKRIIAGNLDKMIGTLEEEVRADAKKMVAQLMAVRKMKKTPLKDRRAYLYGLDPKHGEKPSYRGTCNKFLRHLGCGK